MSSLEKPLVWRGSSCCYILSFLYYRVLKHKLEYCFFRPLCTGLWQVVFCGILLVVMAVGNFVNTMETLILKLMFKVKMKRAKSRQDRPHQN
ncbi:hypothetical protein GQ55_3G158000 [Panicum hallii var. hallii]|uniref:Uncharacterized protein n=1 Tax=Panicum hallii var. hallii TaxID=1504633 RepID=A0A2T7E9X6_9POAL|nr:hypothetical protein GQ55_3G158000 [Panicum hallii var. hallii]